MARSLQRLRSGVDAPPPARMRLAAGSVRAMLDGVDLREIELGSEPSIDRVYVALRDKDWDTIPAAIQNLEIETADSSFRVSFDAVHQADKIDFTWRGTITGTPDGEIHYTMSGVARSAFTYCRIGFCVLHPDTLAGSSYQARTQEGPVRGSLPLLIGPQDIVDGIEIPVAPACDELVVVEPGGTRIRTTISGDLFETEDQRNWTDASFKTYCTPAALGYPFQAQPGQRLEQSVTIRLEGAPAKPLDDDERVAALHLGAGTGHSLPSIGLCVASDEASLTERERDLLRTLALDHLRVDVRPSRDGWQAGLDAASRQARALDTGLEVALHVPSTPSSEGADDDPARRSVVAAVGERLRGQRVARWLVFDEATAGTGSTPSGLGSLVRDALAATHPNATIVGGTDGDFAELNRDRPDVRDLDALSYSMNPQVHASDDRTLTETVTTHGVTVETARSFADGRPVVVSPVTLAPRFNPVATGPEGPTPSGGLPRSVDHRQPSLLGAAWTVGSVAHLAAARAAAVTWFETVGWRGLIERASGSRAPESFLSEPGEVFPAFFVFADLARMRGGELLATVSSAPRALAGLAIRQRDRVIEIVANLTPEELPVAIQPVGTEVLARALDETTAARAMAEPEAYRQVSQDLRTTEGRLELRLRPYAVVAFESDAVDKR